MADWKSLQQIVNDRADSKLRAAIDGCISSGDFSNINVTLGNGGAEMKLAEIQSAIKRALFAANRDKWRSKEGDDFVVKALNIQ